MTIPDDVAAGLIVAAVIAIPTIAAAFAVLQSRVREHTREIKALTKRIEEQEKDQDRALEKIANKLIDALGRGHAGPH